MTNLQIERAERLGCYGGGGSGQARPNPRFAAWVRAGLVAFVVAGASGCKTATSIARSPVPEEARTSLQRGFELEDEGRDDEAIAAWRRAFELAPEYVDAHRAYQNLMLERGRRGQLIEEYRAAVEQAPNSAVRVYLLSRLWSERSRQRAGFERAVALDPDFFFANLGAGYASLSDGDLVRAENAFERARALEPERTEPLVGLVETLGRRLDDDGQRRMEKVARELLERDPTSTTAIRRLTEVRLRKGDVAEACSTLTRFVAATDSPEAWDLVDRVLADHARTADLEAARDRLGGVSSAPWEGGEALALARVKALASLETRCGNPASALRLLERLPPQLVNDATLDEVRRDAQIASGHVREAVDDIDRARYAAGFLLADETGAAARLEEARGVLAATGPLAPDAAARLVARLREAGLVDAALETAAAALERDPGDARLLRAQDELLRHRRFVGELREYFVRGYRDPVEARASIEEVLDDVREISRACLGENVVDPVRVAAYYPIGAFLDPDPKNGGGLARYFDDFGTFFLVGQRAFGPPEAYAIRRVAAGHVEIDGRSTYRVLGEDLVIEPRAEWGGAEIAGFAFDTFLVLNVDRARSFAHRAARLYDEFGPDAADLLSDPVPLARGGLERVDPSEPLGLGAKAMFRSYARHLRAGNSAASYAGVALDAFESHERAHIEDARRFLPIASGLLEKIRLLGRLGFAPARVEAWLEERAQAQALATAASPWAVIAGTADLLPNRNDAPPHSVGFFDLSKRWIAAIDREPEAFPTIDRDRPILPQLDRLSEDDLRRLGRMVVADEDPLPPAAE